MSEYTHEAIDVSQAYSAAMDSANLINEMYDNGLDVDEEDLATIDRNKEHLIIMLGKEFWTEAQDLEPIIAATNRG